MSFADKKGITVASGFMLQAQSPLDARFTADTIADRDELVTLKAAYEGLTVYVVAEKKSYVYKTTEWEEVTTGAGYVHPTTAGNKHIPAGGATGQILKYKANGEAQWGPETTYNKATAATDGLMSKEHFVKVEGVEEGANKTVVDAALSATSTNPVQNKIVKAELDKKLNAALKGVANGVAELDATGKVPAAQLPSYVDDVLEGYLSGGKFYVEAAHTTEITGESGKIYVDVATGKTYRWSGSAFTEISASLALGATSSTAFRGDRGKIAYDHSQTAHAPADAQKNVQSDWNVTDTASDAFIKNKPTSLPANGGNADTVGGHTVAVDVPANAVFTDTKPVEMKGATASVAGAAGYAPAPTAGSQAKYLRGDGTWQTPPNTTYQPATQSVNGLMSADDKKKLDNQPQIYFADALPDTAPTGSVCFLIS